jgi:hypothetical protein
MQCFELDVDLDVFMAGKQVWVVLQRALNTVRKEPAQLVTALRIVEREERADQYALQVIVLLCSTLRHHAYKSGKFDDKILL